MMKPCLRLSSLCLLLLVLMASRRVALAQQQTQSLRVSDARQKKIDDLVRAQQHPQWNNVDVYHQEGLLDISDLHVTDEREVGPICNAVRRIAVGTIGLLEPLTSDVVQRDGLEFECRCTYWWIVPWVRFVCEGQVCARALEEIFNFDLANDVTLPLIGETCVQGRAQGRLVPLRRAVRRGRIRTNAFDMVVDLAALAAQGYNTSSSSDETQETVRVPDVEWRFRTENGINPIQLRSCRMEIDGSMCASCRICNGGLGVQLDCVTQLERFLPQFMHPYLQDSPQECIFSSFRDGTSTTNFAFLKPLLTLPVIGDQNTTTTNTTTDDDDSPLVIGNRSHSDP